MSEIRIGIVGGGYMGKAHAVAMSAVASVFETRLRPVLEMVAATSPASAARYRDAFGFRRATDNALALASDPDIDAVIIASPQETHRRIAEAALLAGKHVMCEKPLGASLEDGRAMVAAAKKAGTVNMVGFNYVRTPATQFARKLVAEGRIGDVTWFRGEHTEDFLADPELEGNWRTRGDSNGTMGDLAPHMINCALAFMGGIEVVNADIETVHTERPESGGTGKVTNDDQGHMLCRFKNGVMGHLFFSRIATGRKMGYIYEINGTKGAIRFDGEDQNALWLYDAAGPEAERGFRKVFTGPEHPDYLPFCQGPGHGTGYQDQIIIEAKDFLEAIADGQPRWPTFKNGLEVNCIIEAARRSSAKRTWINVADIDH